VPSDFGVHQSLVQKEDNNKYREKTGKEMKLKVSVSRLKRIQLI